MMLLMIQGMIQVMGLMALLTLSGGVLISLLARAMGIHS